MSDEQGDVRDDYRTRIARELERREMELGVAEHELRAAQRKLLIIDQQRQVRESDSRRVMLRESNRGALIEEVRRLEGIVRSNENEIAKARDRLRELDEL